MKRYANLMATFVVALALSAVQAGAFTGPTSPESDARVAKGDQLLAEGKFDEARDEYRAALEIVRSEKRLATTEMRRLANSYYYEKRYTTAALMLEDLADAASLFGDLATEAWAIADAAWMYGRAAGEDIAAQRQRREDWSGGKLQETAVSYRATIDLDRTVARLELLLQSRYLPDDVREEIQTKRLADLKSVASK